MKNTLLLALAVFTGLFICSNGFGYGQKQHGEFTVVFSANLNGELEPCG